MTIPIVVDYATWKTQMTGLTGAAIYYCYLDAGGGTLTILGVHSSLPELSLIYQGTNPASFSTDFPAAVQVQGFSLQ